MITRCFVVVSAMAMIIPSETNAANPVGTNASDDRVRQILTLESVSDSAMVDRRKELQPAVHPETATNAAWWQAGFVKVGSGWRHAENTADLDSAVLQEYRTQRDGTPKTVEGQMKLANWCRDHKLFDQERAHLSQVVMLSPMGFDRAPIYRRIGYRQLGEHWLSPVELHALQELYRRDEEHLREWRPAVERIVRNWGASAKQHKQAQDELNAIDDPAAIPALLIATSMSESLALAICERLNAISAFDAAQGLATIGVRSEWSTVREQATKYLKGRRIDDFAPALLAEMRSPFSKAKPNSSTAEPRLIFREESDRYVAIDLRFFSGGVLLVDRRPRFQANLRRGDRAAPTALLSGSRSRIDQSRFVEDVDHQLQMQMDEENDRTEEYNRRASTILTAVSGQENSSDPKYWWTWWSLHTGTQLPPKGVEVHLLKARLPTEITVAPLPGFSSHGACLIAGTPVVTERGLIAIDKIQVGDQVLAKDINSGEIDYKPVLHTTVRPPVSVKRFVVAETPIVASEAHNFWSSGTGWAKTRDLKQGQPIHTATGMSRVESIETEPDLAPVYNLIVADFHTYFVGPAMVLSHDVLQPSPTNIKVPGLD